MTLIHLLLKNIDLGLKTKNFRLKDFSFSDPLSSVNGYQRFATKWNWKSVILITFRHLKSTFMSSYSPKKASSLQSRAITAEMVQYSVYCNVLLWMWHCMSVICLFKRAFGNVLARIHSTFKALQKLTSCHAK